MYFSKMHGLGNDFVVIDNINQNVTFSIKMIKKLSNRNTGIGFDQLLLVEKSNNKKYDFYYRIFNSDGSEVFQCGNGARCFAYFVYLKKLTNKKKIFVKTYTSDICIKIINKNEIIVNMGKPKFNIHNIPKFHIDNFSLQTLNINNQIIQFGNIFIGNPHCIIVVHNIKKYPVGKIGKIINSNYNDFPDGVNVNFMEVISPNSIILRVYERGVGETQACGSGACASVVFGILQKILSSSVVVTLSGGNLKISWMGDTHSVYMSGPAEHVYDGYIKV
ncbi:Diaminopimelate epimerase [Buchnera aphidicola (Myzocallis carpini)]